MNHWLYDALVFLCKAALSCQWPPLWLSVSLYCAVSQAIVRHSASAMPALVIVRSWICLFVFISPHLPMETNSALLPEKLLRWCNIRYFAQFNI